MRKKSFKLNLPLLIVLEINLSEKKQGLLFRMLIELKVKDVDRTYTSYIYIIHLFKPQHRK